MEGLLLFKFFWQAKMYRGFRGPQPRSSELLVILSLVGCFEKEVWEGDMFIQISKVAKKQPFWSRSMGVNDLILQMGDSKSIVVTKLD